MSASLLLGLFLGIVIGMLIGWYLRGAHERERAVHRLATKVTDAASSEEGKS